ncbi:MAG: acyl--CoA ligase [Methanospirillum sp.]|uniref:class I adenylate-forming enzyme family protein n=1 Tax=Methanospirillum sp. TaxID=45200 RepID=UPI002369F42D|nr:class I adenylate-forming enzyme family protein [Methanospirillum sp.]MDD1729566.1 acyl--CoA ligase [Methanospirillum sp.]
MFNITSFLDIRAHEHPEKTALIHPSQKISYTWRELHDAVVHTSEGLAERGITKGDRVVLYLDSSAGYLISYFSLWRIGAVVVPANIVYREDELRYVVEDSGACGIITDGTGREVAEKVAHALGVSHLIISGGDEENSLENLLKSSPLQYPCPCKLDDICQIQYTSGTTGKPKGAMLTQGGWAAALDAERDALELIPDDIYLGIYPMGHVGVSWGISILKQGGTWIIMERFHLDTYLNLAEKYQVTILAAMPPVIHSIMDTPPETEKKLRSVRRIISGGGPMHAPTWRAFHKRFGTPIINAYGLSETIVIGSGTVIRPEHYPTADEYNSVGTPVGYAEVRVVDEKEPNRTLPPMEAGEIAIRGPAVALGYWQKPEETAAVFLPDGWFLTGDIGYIDKNGMLVITDRKKDMIIMSGWKIYPTEVENSLILHPDIDDIAVFGCLDEEKGEIPAAAVVPREGCTVTHENIVAFAKQHLAGYKIPRKTIIVDSLPRVGGWKLLRRELRDQYCNT